VPLALPVFSARIKPGTGKASDAQVSAFLKTDP
jgi:hypothetical protein